MTNFEKVGEFMETGEQKIYDSNQPPEFPDSDTVRLRIDLIAEEFNEFIGAIEERDIVEVADALADLLYVIYGAGHAYNIDLDACFGEVHDSNMSKFEGGVVKNAAGKIMKGPNFREPDLKSVMGLD